MWKSRCEANHLPATPLHHIGRDSTTKQLVVCGCEFEIFIVQENFSRPVRLPYTENRVEEYLWIGVRRSQEAVEEAETKRGCRPFSCKIWAGRRLEVANCFWTSEFLEGYCNYMYKFLKINYF
ncbi:hypothetical protein AVEN_187452-1 [Araneus ventricosus]|uniref:Uncharacterized protein n=1 Tax=Araneus ventricosus TaxID=182803 RepID=A0A4Y2BSK5_ARAVE|nr:hypothetical protein AVEN_187452-1 [Araneus ventricosus]